MLQFMIMQLKKKITCNQYDKFPPEVYRAFTYLNSEIFLDLVKKITNIKNLITDIGLHGGGLHIHPNGGKLNIHKDYSIHPKLKKERRLNLIIYMTKNWNEKWGGHLEFWSHDKKRNKPLKLIKKFKISSIEQFYLTHHKTVGMVYHQLLNYLLEKDKVWLFIIFLSQDPKLKIVKSIVRPTKKQEKNKKILELIKKDQI